MYSLGFINVASSDNKRRRHLLQTIPCTK